MLAGQSLCGNVLWTAAPSTNFVVSYQDFQQFWAYVKLMLIKQIIKEKGKVSEEDREVYFEDTDKNLQDKAYDFARNVNVQKKIIKTWL